LGTAATLVFVGDPAWASLGDGLTTLDEGFPSFAKSELFEGVLRLTNKSAAPTNNSIAVTAAERKLTDKFRITNG
jgi:hypothetical protein